VEKRKGKEEIGKSFLSLLFFFSPLFLFFFMLVWDGWMDGWANAQTNSTRKKTKQKTEKTNPKKLQQHTMYTCLFFFICKSLRGDGSNSYFSHFCILSLDK